MTADHDAALAAWVSKLNRMGTEIDAQAASMHPSVWPEALEADFERFRKLAAGGPVDPDLAQARRLVTSWPVGESAQLALWNVSLPDTPAPADGDDPLLESLRGVRQSMETTRDGLQRVVASLNASTTSFAAAPVEAQPDAAPVPANPIDSDVLDVLRRATCAGFSLYLPPGQLDRKLYQRVNEVLERLGGKWKSGKVKAHVFDNDPAPLLAEVLATGAMPAKNPLGFFRTPRDVVRQMLAFVQGDPETILEPSAGDGAIVHELVDAFPNAWIRAYELDPRRAEKLTQTTPRGVTVVVADFLGQTGIPVDAVVMNPPFAVARDANEYVAHIAHAYHWLKPGGSLVSIAPAGLKFRQDKRIAALRELFETYGGIEDIAPQAFAESGTNVATVIAHLIKL